jgi:TIR domain-containing protein
MGYLTFISHSGEDAWLARKLSADCKALGAETFLDEEQIAIGGRFENEISTALSNAKELVVIVTPWALQRPYVWLEIGVAWYRQIPIIVLLLGITRAEFQSQATIPVALKERNILALNNVDRYLDELAVRVKNCGIEQ